MIDARSVGKSVAGPEGTLHILDDIDLRIDEGDSVAIVGASGSGKTTLLGLLAGLDLPTHGQITLAGKALASLDEEARAALRAREVGFVFQSFHLLPSLTAEENVALPLELAGREDPARVREVLQAVGLAARARHYPRQLSGGEQQRVAVGRALANRPALVLADEPTGNLDERTADIVIDEFIRLVREQGSAALIATHNERLAARMDRIVRLHDGLLE